MSKTTSGNVGETEESYRILAETASDAIIRIDENSTIEFVNTAAARIFGYAKAEMVGQSLTMLMSEEMRAQHRNGFARYLQTGERNLNWQSIEVPARHKDGRKFPIEISFGEYLRDGKRFFIGIARDISERKKAEEQLRRNHETFFNLVQNAPFGIYVIDSEFRLIQVSTGSRKVFSNIHPLIGRDFAEILRTIWEEPFAGAAIGRFRHTLATGEPYRAVNTTEHRANIDDVESYDWKIERVVLPDGTFGVVCYFYDLTEQRQAEQALRESEERLRLALDAGKFGTWELNLNTKGFFWNEQTRRLFGVSPDEPLSYEEMFWKIIPAEDHELVRAAAREALNPKGLGIYDVQHRVRLKDGSIRWLHNIGRVIFEGEGDARRPLLMRGTVADITTRKLSEDHIAFANERFRLAEEASNGMVYEWDLANNRVSRSENFVNLAGYELSEIAETNEAWRELMHADDVSQAASDINSIFDKDDKFSVEYRIRHKKGHYINILDRSKAIRNERGEIVRIVGSSVDITARKEAENERERLLEIEQNMRKTAEETSRLKDEFLATVSHELRTPLNAILGWATMVRKSGFEIETMRRAFEVVERNSRNQNQIISDILDVSRIITGKLNLNLFPLRLAPIIRAAADTVYPAVEAKNINLEMNLDAGDAKVTGDGDRLQQIIWNLLSNAVKFTPDGGTIEIALRYTENFAEIVVTDSGDGIKPEFLPYVFDRFRQGDGNTNRRHGGLGLGLSIVRNLVELHGGSVLVNNKRKGHGAIFSVSLPLKPETAETAVQTENAENAPRRALENLKILVVDDERDALELAAFILKGEGAQVFTAESVDEALKIFDAQTLDAVVSDIGMPEKDGFDLIREIKSRTAQNNQTFPTVALTAYAGEEDNRRFLQAGYRAYIPKPLEPSMLIEIIAEVTNNAEISPE